jgi:hypothetical protein
MSIDIARIVALAETVEPLEDEKEGYTAHKISKVINETFATLGVELTIDPQYTYNDSRNGKINGVKSVKGEKTRYTEVEVEQYVAKFVASRVRGTKVLAELPDTTEDDEQELRELADLEDADKE